MCRGCFTEDVVIAHLPWRSTLEARAGGEVVGVLEYAVRGTWAVLARTEVTDDGVAHGLVRAALDLLRARGYRILPVCPHAQAFLGAHPEEVDAIDDVPTRPVAPTQRHGEVSRTPVGHARHAHHPQVVPVMRGVGR